MAKVQLPDNSFEAQAARNTEPPEKVNKVIRGKATVRQKSKSARALGYFINDDIGSVREWVFKEVLVPKIKDILYSVITGSSSMMLYGDTRGVRSSRGRREPPRESYSEYYRDYYGRGSRPQPPRRDTYDRAAIVNRYGINTDIELTYEDAEDVIRAMQDYLDMYPTIDVYKYYEFCFDDTEMPPIDYTLRDYGWTNIDGARPIPSRNGMYIIRFPRRPVPID